MRVLSKTRIRVLQNPQFHIPKPAGSALKVTLLQTRIIALKTRIRVFKTRIRVLTPQKPPTDV